MQMHYRWRNPRHPNPPRSELLKFARAAADAAGLPAAADWMLEVDFVGDRTMTRLNDEMLGHIGTTDVITFSYFDDAETFFPGDTGVELYINADIAAREGAKRPGGYSRELALYLVHGLLHSAGEDDLEPVPRRRMRMRERQVLGKLEQLFDFDKIFPEA